VAPSDPPGAAAAHPDQRVHQGNSEEQLLLDSDFHQCFIEQGGSLN
jgi:hypothetical protein